MNIIIKPLKIQKIIFQIRVPMGRTKLIIIRKTKIEIITKSLLIKFQCLSDTCSGVFPEMNISFSDLEDLRKIILRIYVKLKKISVKMDNIAIKVFKLSS
ncbi:MAG: hypothetical protein Q8M97_04475 [Methanobacteriaceae archaeon]|nr:hypothetical protein [Methanobacteriaceae archaeon]